MFIVMAMVFLYYDGKIKLTLFQYKVSLQYDQSNHSIHANNPCHSIYGMFGYFTVSESNCPKCVDLVIACKCVITHAGLHPGSREMGGMPPTDLKNGGHLITTWGAWNARSEKYGISRTFVNLYMSLK